MVHQLGIPTIFFSMSSPDTNWVPLLKCLGLLWIKKFTQMNVSQMKCLFTKIANWLQHILQYAVDTSKFVLRNT